MPYNPHRPQDGDKLHADKLRDQWNGLAGQIAGILAGAPGQDGQDGRDGTDGRSLTLRGDWNGSDLYAPGDLAWHNGLLYMSLENNSGIAPEGDPRWRLLSIVGAPGEVTTEQLNDAINGAIAVSGRPNAATKGRIDAATSDPATPHFVLQQNLCNLRVETLLQDKMFFWSM